MRVIGPANWPSVSSLQAALQDVEGADLRWGQRGFDGLQQLEKFKEAELLCPVFTTDRNTAIEWEREGTRTYGRRRHHTQGWDIVGSGYKPVSKYGKETWNHKWLYRDFWVQILPIEEEFRQHVWDGKCIRVGKKVKTGEGDRPSAQPIRSRRNGWTLDYGYKVPKNLRRDVRDVARRAVGALGYMGGAVDLVVSSGKVYVLEVNSAPALRDAKTLDAYVNAIKGGQAGVELQKG